MSRHYKSRKLTDKVKLPKAKPKSPAAVVFALEDWRNAMTRKVGAMMHVTLADLDELGARIALIEEQMVAYGDERYHEGERHQVLFPKGDA